MAANLPREGSGAKAFWKKISWETLIGKRVSSLTLPWWPSHVTLIDLHIPGCVESSGIDVNEVSVGADAAFEKLVFAQLFGDFGSSSWSTGENQIESLIIHVIGPSRSTRARRIVGGGTIGGIDAVEWLAEFVDMTGTVFRYVDEAMTGRALEGAAQGRTYCMGVDLARVKAMGLPHRRDEYWKYTRPDTLTSPEVTKAAVFTMDEAPMFNEFDRLRIVFVDGVFDAAASDDLSLEGVQIDRIADICTQDIHWAKDLYGVLEARGQAPVQRPLAALNKNKKRKSMDGQIQIGGHFLRQIL